MRQWFTLSYDTMRSGQITLRNLQASGCDQIEAAQKQLGSTNFVRTPQCRHYSQIDLDLLKAEVVAQ